MEILNKRFPLVGRMVFKNLDNQSLTQSKNASRTFSEFLVDEKFYWIRVIKKYNGNFVGVEESWREVLRKTPVDMIKQLALVVEEYFKHYFPMFISPLHIVAKKGTLKLFRYVFSRATDKNPIAKLEISIYKIFKMVQLRLGQQKYPRNLTLFQMIALDGNVQLFKLIMDHVDDCNMKSEISPRKLRTPLSMAAENGHFEICRMIVERVEDKNPSEYNGWTPLHHAARNGHLEICELIIERVEEENPANNIGQTPLHFAIKYGHLDICRLIIGEIANKNPAADSGWTPLHTAAHDGHLDICQLIIERVEDKNPEDNLGWTPLHFAAKSGHIDIYHLIIERIANKNPANHNGLTPLMVAPASGDFGIFSFICEILKQSGRL